MEKIGKLTIPATILVMLIFTNFAVDGWHWGHSVIGAIVLGIAIAVLRARDGFL